MQKNHVVTRSSLARDLAKIGIAAGQTVLVHASMRAMHWVCGNATTVVAAFLDALGPSGTLVVPTQTLENRDPARWYHAPVPEAWWPAIRDHLPPYDPAVTPSTNMGAIAEQVRVWPGAVRSPHPLTSFAALGGRARELMATHPLDSLLGEESPMGRLEEAGAKALLLGVGYEKCTAFHLAQYRIPGQPVDELASVVMTSSGRAWLRYRTIRLDDSNFARLGADFERCTGAVTHSTVGGAPSRLLSIPDAVRFATSWLRREQSDTTGEITGKRGRDDK